MELYCSLRAVCASTEFHSQQGADRVDCLQTLSLRLCLGSRSTLLNFGRGEPRPPIWKLNGAGPYTSRSLNLPRRWELSTFSTRPRVASCMRKQIYYSNRCLSKTHSKSFLASHLAHRFPKYMTTHLCCCRKRLQANYHLKIQTPRDLSPDPRVASLIYVESSEVAKFPR